MHAGGAGRTQVMVVEDDPMVALIHQRWIARMPGFDCVPTVSSEAEALALLHTVDVDVLVVDLTLVNSGGVDLIKQVRQGDDPVEIVVATADRSGATVEAVMRLGVCDYLVKPFSEERFRRALHSASVRRQLLAHDTLSQHQIDCIRMAGPPSGPRAETVRRTPKGISTSTLSLVLEALDVPGEGRTADAVAELVGISAVVARRYLGHLVEQGAVVVDHRYGQRGRPTNLYRRRPATAGVR